MEENGETTCRLIIKAATVENMPIRMETCGSMKRAVTRRRVLILSFSFRFDRDVFEKVGVTHVMVITC